MVLRALVLANPAASVIRMPAIRLIALNAVRTALQARGFATIEILEPESADATADAAAAAVSAGYDLVVALGGDGTARTVAGATAGSSTALALVPGGTGNLFAAALGVPRTTADAIDALRYAQPYPVDLGVVEPTAVIPSDLPALARSPFLVAVGSGLDARMILATDHNLKARLGAGAYVLAGLSVARDLRPRAALLEVDGDRHELAALVVLVVNAGELMPGVRPRLPIAPDDGLLDIFVLTGSGPVGAAAGALALLAASSVGQTAAGLRLRGRHVRVTLEPAEPIQVDGDAFAPGGFLATVSPAALQVLLAPR